MRLLHKVNRLWANVAQAPVMPGWLEISEVRDDLVMVRWMANLPDNTDPLRRVSLQPGRLWPITAQMTESQILNTFLLSMLTFIEHEVREGFKYLGEHRYMPHH